MKAQVSFDYAASAFIFSIVILAVFSHLTKIYYTRIWEVRKAEAQMEAERFAYFLVKEQGNWSSNPFLSTSLAFGGEEINSTKLRYFVGMPYQHVATTMSLMKDFKLKIYQLPSIGIYSDIGEGYYNSSTVEINFETTKNSTFYVVVVGGGRSTYKKHVGKFHHFQFNLQNGTYEIRALAVSGNEYGAYEGVIRVI